MARDCGWWDPEALGEVMPTHVLRRWIAFDILEESDANPDLTEWDNEESAARKQKRKAEARAKMKER